MKTQQQKMVNRLKMLFAGLMLINTLSKAQDRMILMNGTELIVEVLEISEEEIKYKLFDNPSGPTRSSLKNEVFSIRYKNGKLELFKEKQTQTVPVQASYSKMPSQTSDFDPDTSDFAKKKRKNFSGPRVGFSYFSPGTTTSYLEENGKRPVTALFGWQFEARLFTIEDGTSGLVEFVPMVGGIDQGLFFPSANFLLGLRGGSDRSWEFAMGPQFGVKADYQNQIQGSMGLVIALGTSFKRGNVWFPVNLALVPSVGSRETVTTVDAKGVVTSTEKTFQTGWKISLIAGFNSRKR